MKKHLLIIPMILLLVLATAIFKLFSTNGEYYRVYSPDKQYSVYASRYYYERFSFRMPGQSGDAAGKVYLFDEIEKRVIHSAAIPMISMTNEIEWDHSIAYFKSDGYPNIADPWHLPRPVKMPYTKIEENDTIRIARAYSSFGQPHATTIYRPISSCWKPLSYETYDEKGNVAFEWQKQYAVTPGNTCDFTSYIIHYRTYNDKKLIAERFEHSACDDCETYPCGTATKWDSLGNTIDTKVYEDCSSNFLPKTPKNE